MRTQRMLIVVLLALLIAGGWWLNASTPPQARTPLAFSSAEAPGGAPRASLAAAEQGQPSAAPASAATPTPEQVMQAQLGDIAAAYQTSMRYPSYSPPLRDSDWNLLNPRAFVPRETPLEGGDGLTASIQLERYIVDREQDLPVTVALFAPDDSASRALASLQRVALGLRRGEQQAGPLRLAEQDSQPDARLFTGLVPAAMLQTLDPGELVLHAELRFAARPTLTASAVIKSYQPTAQLTRLGDAYVDDVHLVIPAHFEVEQPGLYRLQANLFDAASGAPVSHLNHSFMLTADNPVGLLKVHAVTLRDQSAPGPYLLKDINLMRPPPRPGQPTTYGSVSEDTFPVQGFSLDSYSDAPFADPLAEQRLEFLQRISGEQ